MKRMEINGQKELEKERKKKVQTAAGQGFDDQNDYGDYDDEGYGHEDDYYNEQPCDNGFQGQPPMFNPMMGGMMNQAMQNTGIDAGMLTNMMQQLTMNPGMV